MFEQEDPLLKFMIRVQDEIQQEAFARTKCLGPDDILNQLISRYASNKAKDYDFTEQAELLQIITTIAVLRAERDEARRIACEMEERLGCDESGCPKNGLAHDHAKRRGWGCFKENTDG